MRTYLIFPLVTHRLISIQMTNFVLPFAVMHACTDAYLKTVREVYRCGDGVRVYG